MRRRSLRHALCLLLTGVFVAWVLPAWVPAAAADTGPLDQPVSTALLKQLRQISRQGLSAAPDYENGLLKAIHDKQAVAATPPQLLYVGADFCPYCAALRWPLALTLMRFGELSGLRYMRSSAHDVYPNTATFSFYRAHLDSDRLQLEAVEIKDRQKQPLQDLTTTQRRLLLRYDMPPYTRTPGSIPFLDIGGRFMESGSPFSPDTLRNLNWQQIAERLQAGHNPVWRDIIGETNLLTAAVCMRTGQQPTAVCQASGVHAAAKALPE